MVAFPMPIYSSLQSDESLFWAGTVDGSSWFVGAVSSLFRMPFWKFVEICAEPTLLIKGRNRRTNDNRKWLLLEIKIWVHFLLLSPARGYLALWCWVKPLSDVVARNSYQMAKDNVRRELKNVYSLPIFYRHLIAYCQFNCHIRTTMMG